MLVLALPLLLGAFLPDSHKLTLFVNDDLAKRTWTADGRPVRGYIIPQSTWSYLAPHAEPRTVERTLYLQVEGKAPESWPSVQFRVTTPERRMSGITWVGRLNVTTPGKGPWGALYSFHPPTGISSAQVAIGISDAPWRKVASYAAGKTTGADLRPQLRQEYLDKRHITLQGSPYDPDDGVTMFSVYVPSYSEPLTMRAFDKHGMIMGHTSDFVDSHGRKWVMFNGLLRDLDHMDFLSRRYSWTTMGKVRIGSPI